MNTPPENEFVELRKLLALKSHEQPPPGYFSRFSVGVISELRASRRARRSTENYSDVPSWIVWIFERLQARPAFAGALGTMLCAGLIVGVFFLETDAAGPAPFHALMTEASTATQPNIASAVTGPSDMGSEPTGLDMAPMLGETNTRPSLFDIMPGLETAPVSDQPY